MREEAIDLVTFLASYEEQKRRAIEGAYNPTIAALHQDDGVLAANPFFGELFDSFVNAVARPSDVTGARYNQVSTEFRNAAHNTLNGSMSADRALSQLERKLERQARSWR